jgi:hypothetical protein
MKHVLLGFALFALIPMQRVLTQIPSTMSYQGVLADANRTPVPDGNVTLTFRMYDALTDGTALWQETQQVAVSKGVFSAILGSVTPLNLPFDKPYWLGITVAEGTELTPRVALTASPYSLNSHSTIAEPAIGQGLTIRNAQGKATHVLSADGSSSHTGKTVLEGGAEIPLTDSTTANFPRVGLRVAGLDTAIVAFSPGGPALSGISGRVAGQAKPASTQTVAQGLEGAVTGQSEDAIGVYGESTNGPGVRAASVNGAGVSATSTNHKGGVFNSAKESGIYATGSPAGTFDGNVHLIGELYAQSMHVATFRFVGDDEFVVQDSLVDFNSDGTTKFKKPVVLTGDSKLIFPDGSEQSTASAGGTFNGILQGKALVVKSSAGTEVFKVDTNGTSLHKGDETFEGDVILKGQSGKGAKLVDANGITLAGFGRIDSATNQRLGVYGKAETAGDLAGAFDGNVEIDGEVYASSLHIVRAPGDTVMHFNADGTSEHSGLETFKAGLQTVLTNGNILRINPSEGLTLKTATGQFRGHMDPNGNAFFFGNVSKGGGSFKIDHPLDPANKYLYHSFVESPDMMNIYNGNVTLDDDGEAVVQLPAWFEALNRDFRYQLTAIGAPGPNLYVAEKISGNRFKIAGGTDGMEVSWQVTGVRKDAYAERHRIPVEESKPATERGHYLHPEAFGLPTEMGMSMLSESQRDSGNNGTEGSEE